MAKLFEIDYYLEKRSSFMLQINIIVGITGSVGNRKNLSSSIGFYLFRILSVVLTTISLLYPIQHLRSIFCSRSNNLQDPDESSIREYTYTYHLYIPNLMNVTHPYCYRDETRCVYPPLLISISIVLFGLPILVIIFNLIYIKLMKSISQRFCCHNLNSLYLPIPIMSTHRIGEQDTQNQVVAMH